MLQNSTGRGYRFVEDEAAFARAFRFEENPLRGLDVADNLDELAHVRAGTLSW